MLVCGTSPRYEWGMERTAATIAVAVVLAAALIVEGVACIDVETTLLCENAWCNHRGECEDDGVEARCTCDDGFEAVPGYLRCVPADGERFTFVEFPLAIATFSMGSPANEEGRQSWTQHQEADYDRQENVLDVEQLTVPKAHVVITFVITSLDTPDRTPSGAR